MTMPIDDFIPISGQSGYFVSRSGQVWSERSGRVIVGCLCGFGYRAISFPDGERRYIHRIVCEAFHGPRPQGMEVRHLNGDRCDNSAVNLAWGTRQQNEDDRKRHGTTAKGVRNPQAKLNPSVVAEMRNLRREAGLSFQRIAARYGVSPMTAHRAITGTSWAD